MLPSAVLELFDFFLCISFEARGSLKAPCDLFSSPRGLPWQQPEEAQVGRGARAGASSHVLLVHWGLTRAPSVVQCSQRV